MDILQIRRLIYQIPGGDLQADIISKTGKLNIANRRSVKRQLREQKNKDRNRHPETATNIVLLREIHKPT